MPKSRISYFVRLEYEGEGVYVGKVSNFVKVTLPAGAPPAGEQDGEQKVLRLALCDLFRAEELSAWFGTVLHIRAGVAPSKPGYPAAVGHIQHKMAWCKGTLGKPEYRRNIWRFVSYHNTYGKLDLPEQGVANA